MFELSHVFFFKDKFTCGIGNLLCLIQLSIQTKK